jgi:hypothetical protein
VDGWTWLIGEAIEQGHNPWELSQGELDEQAEIEAWIDAGCPPVEDWRAGRGSRPAKMPTRTKPVEPPPVALAVNQEVAAALLSCSVDHLQRHILPKLKVVQAGARMLIPVRELEDYLNRESARALG